MDIKSRMGLQVGDTCEIYRIFEPDTRLYCHVLDLSDEWVVVSRRDFDGEYLGLTLFGFESIFKIRYGSKHAKLLFSQEATIKFPNAPTGDLSVEWLKELGSLFGSVTIYNEDISSDSAVIGTVYDASDDVIFINEYRPIPSLERTICAIRRHEITRVEAGGEYEKRLVSYYKT